MLPDEPRHVNRTGRPAAGTAPGMGWRGLLFSEYFVFYLSVLLFVGALPFVPSLADPANLANVLSNVWPLLAVAIGQTFVLIVAGIDLSQTSIMAVTSVIGASLITRAADPNLLGTSPLWGRLLSEGGGPLASSPWAPLGAVAAMLCIGALIGFVNGTAITRLQMPAFMVTLVSQIFFAAFAIWLTRSENIINLPESFIGIGKGSLLFVPSALLVTVALGLAAHFLLGRTVMGRWLYATGTNPRASLVSGVPVARAVTMAYAASGFCAAVGAVLYTARLETGRPTLGSGNLLDVIGATVIGGTSLFGGKGRVIWTFFGVLFFVLLDNTLNLLNLSFYTVTVVKGSVIVLAALLDVARTRLAGR